MRPNWFPVCVINISTSFSTTPIQERYSLVEYSGVPVGVDVGGHLDIGVSHQLFRHIERDAGPLEVCAECMPQAVLYLYTIIIASGDYYF